MISLKNRGWVRLHRKIDENELWFLEPFTKAQAWIDLFLQANHKDGIIEIRGNIINIKRGQIGWSELTMVKRWSWSKNKVRRFLKLLETKQQIEQQKSALTTIITIKNYDEYQEDETTDETAERQQKDSRRNTNKNVNNEKNDKKVIVSEQSSPEVQEIFKIFYEINPTINFGNTTQRKSALNLIKRLGAEKAIGSAKAAVAIYGKQYAPTITTPLQLESKLSELVAFYKKNNSSNVVSI